MSTKLDDKLRLKELINQINWKKAFSRRQSILGATEIFRILKTKKHEYDCFGSALINFQYGVEVVNIMKILNQSYTDDAEQKFLDNLTEWVAESVAIRDRFIAGQLEKKANLRNIPSRDLRANILQELQESQELISSRYKSFNTFFIKCMDQHSDIAAILEVHEEIKVIKTRISTCLTALIEKKKAIANLLDSLLVEFISDDIDKAIEILNCQADNLLAGILSSIEETNALVRTLKRQRKSGDNASEGSDGGRGGRDGRDGRDSRDGRDARDGRDGRDVRDGRDGRDGRDSLDSLDDLDGLDAYGREGEGSSEDSEGVGEGEKRGKGDESSSDGSKDGDGADGGDGGEGDLGYLMGAVGKPLIKALVNCVLLNPADPICYISGYMENYRDSEEKAELKFEHLKLLLAERERIQLLKKQRLEEELRQRELEEAMRCMQNEEEGETEDYGAAAVKQEEA